MDAAREHLWGQLVLERNVIGREDLGRLASERDALVQRGQDASIGQLLVQQRRLDPTAFAALTREVEGRGRACYVCRRVYLAARPDEPPTCPQCGGNTTLRQNGAPGMSGRFQPPMMPMTGRFPAQGVGSSSSSRLAAPVGTGFFPVQGPPTPHGLQAAWGGAAPGFAPPQTGSYRGPGPAPSGAHRAVDDSARYDPAAAASPMPGFGTAPSGPPPSTASDAGEVSSGDLGIGKRFGKYEIVQELGRGGMGVVYKVRCAGQPGFLAVKVLLAGEFASPKLMERFREEARLAKRLRHPNIVAVHDVGEVDGIPFYAMDYIEGSELQDMIRQKNLPVRRGVEILVEVARAAHHAHEHGVVHRDLKPSNILISSAGTSYIMDFGLAKNLEDDKGLTRSGVAIGTPYYMPPEQARGSHREMDARSDVYALGAILYEVLTRRVPFTAKTQNELLRKIVEEEPQAPRLVKNGVPAELDTICLKALQKNKADRYESALALAEDLERWLAGKQIEARPEPIWSVLLRKAKKNRAATAAAGGVALLVLLSGVVIWQVQRSYVEKERQAAEQRRKDEEQRKKEEEARRVEEERKARLRDELARKQTAAGEAARKGLAKSLEARQVTTVADALRSYEDAERLLSQAVELERELSESKRERPSTVYQRALVRRALCRWDEAREDFTFASRDPAHQARAHLARALIKLRWECDRQGATAALGEAVVSPSLEPGAEGREEELTAQGIARAYLTFLQGNEESARRQLVEHAAARNLMAAEGSAAIAFIARSEGAMMGGDAHLERGQRTAESAVLADPWRYDHRVDRAILRARAGNVEGGLDDLRVARALCAEGEMPDLAEALVAMRRRDASRIEDAVRAAEQKAARRSQKCSQEVAAFVRRLRAARPLTPEPPPEDRPPPPRDRGEKIVITQDGEWTLTFTQGPAGQARELELTVPEETESVRIALRGAPGDLDLFVEHGALPQAVNRAAHTSTADAGDETLVIGRKGKTPLRTGKYQGIVRLMVAAPRSFDCKLTVRYYKRNTPAPHPWLEVRSLVNVDLDARQEARGAEATRARASGDHRTAIRILQELEQLQPELAVIRAGWVMETGAYDDSMAILDGLPPDLRDGAPALFMRANLAMQAGKLEDARRGLRKFLDRFPDYLEVRLMHADLCARLKDAKGLLDAGKEIQRMDPLEPAASALLGGGEILQGKVQEGFEKVRRVVLDADSSQSVRNQAIDLLMRLGQAQKAIELVDQLGDRGERSLLLDLTKARALAMLGKKDEGIELLRAARSKVGGNPQLLGVIDEAIKELEQGKYDR